MSIIARIVQALGVGALNPVVLTMLSSVFGADERGSVMGWWRLGVVVGPAPGPTLGGILTQYCGGLIFFVNIHFGIVVLLLSVKYLHGIRKKSENAPPLDLTGYILFTLFIVLLQYSIASIGKVGFSSAELYINFSIFILCFIGFIKTALKKKDPVLNLSLFKKKEFVAGRTITAVRPVALFGQLFLLPFLLQGLMGYSELEIDLLLLPASAAIALLML